MKSAREYIDYLRDMIEAADKAAQFVKDVNFEAFCKNEEKIFAVIRALEIIGEAAKNIPKSMRGRYGEVPWDDIIGMRNPHLVFPLTPHLLITPSPLFSIIFMVSPSPHPLFSLSFFSTAGHLLMSRPASWVV